MDVRLVLTAVIVVFVRLDTITLELLELGPVHFVRLSVRFVHLRLYVRVVQLVIG